MRARVSAAAQDGLVFAVKWLVVLAVWIVGSGWVFGDYLAVRQQAARGDQAYRALVKAQQQTQGVSPEASKRGPESPQSR